ncbi:hypothetical protein [Streptomyces sp. NBC_00989]|uniref:hypothetical protein n=1 Tax=Streptomyces sp. NBC_00989 TaxID=2903705 RepID=UPI002F90D86B|nr:hypothetical protein OG714_54935 [Streptomyces sp. NBC_00989]
MRELTSPQPSLTIFVDESADLAEQPGVRDAVRELLLLGRKRGLSLSAYDRAPNGLPRFWQYPTVEAYTAAWTPTASTPPVAGSPAG